jgi:hypothetical protein
MFAALDEEQIALRSASHDGFNRTASRWWFSALVIQNAHLRYFPRLMQVEVEPREHKQPLHCARRAEHYPFVDHRNASQFMDKWKFTAFEVNFSRFSPSRASLWCRICHFKSQMFCRFMLAFFSQCTSAAIFLHKSEKEETERQPSRCEKHKERSETVLETEEETVTKISHGANGSRRAGTSQSRPRLLLFNNFWQSKRDFRAKTQVMTTINRGFTTTPPSHIVKHSRSTARFMFRFEIFMQSLRRDCEVDYDSY